VTRFRPVFRGNQSFQTARKAGPQGNLKWKRPTASLVISLIALFVALSGGSYAFSGIGNSGPSQVSANRASLGQISANKFNYKKCLKKAAKNKNKRDATLERWRCYISLNSVNIVTNRSSIRELWNHFNAEVRVSKRFEALYAENRDKVWAAITDNKDRIAKLDRPRSVTTRSDTVAVESYGSNGTAVSCQADEVLTGGGADWTSKPGIPTYTNLLAIVQSKPDGNSWVARGDNYTETDNGLTVFAVCIKR
jgi:hypothetical protein